MERLTELHHSNQGYYMTCSGVMHCRQDCVNCEKFEELVDRLGAYEDTGLTPQEIAVLMDRTAKKTIDAVVESIPALVQTISENMPRLIDKVADKIRIQPPKEE